MGGSCVSANLVETRDLGLLFYFFIVLIDFYLGNYSMLMSRLRGAREKHAVGSRRTYILVFQLSLVFDTFWDLV